MTTRNTRNTRNTRTTAATRVAAASAAIVMTTLIFISQIGLARHYASGADAVVAAQRAAPVAQSTANRATRQSGQRT